jgi:elongation factor P hydroxylase
MRVVQIMNKYKRVEILKKKALMHVDEYKFVQGLEGDTNHDTVAFQQYVQQQILEKFSNEVI